MMLVFVLDLYFLSFFFFKQKTAYEMRISDWSSDVCSSDLGALHRAARAGASGRLSRGRPGAAESGADGRDAHDREGADGARGGVAAVARLRDRSEARRVGEECVSKCRSRW